MRESVEDEIERRLDSHIKTLLQTFALIRDDLISIREAKRRNRGADRELRSIRELVAKSKKRRKSQKERPLQFKNPFDKIRRTYTKPPGSRSKWP